jgi:adenylylsulfate kinase-like enzyme
VTHATGKGPPPSNPAEGRRTDRVEIHGRKQLEALIDDLARSYLRDDPVNSEQGRGEICRQITEVADGLRSAGEAKVLARVRDYRSDVEAALSREVRRHLRYLLARALSRAESA